MPGRGTTDAIFILRQMHEKFLGKRKDLFFAFVDLEKAFDRVPRDVLWWSMRKLGIEEWLIGVIQSMYVNAKSSVRVKDQLSPEFSVKVGVHQGSVLSPLLFTIVMEALSQDFRNGCPWELLYADDLVIMAESIDELVQRFSAWKTGLESKGLRVNMFRCLKLKSSAADMTFNLRKILPNGRVVSVRKVLVETRSSVIIANTGFTSNVLVYVEN